MKIRISILSAVFFLINVFPCLAMAKPIVNEPGVGLTVYNDNLAVVKERRMMEFERGINNMKFTGVAERIDPTSVNFKTLTDSLSVSILEQNYEYDLVSTDALLKRNLDSNVRIYVRGSGADRGTVIEGTLLSARGDVIIKKSDGGISMLKSNMIERVEITEAPANLLTKPTLVWLAQSQNAGAGLSQVTYMTDGIQWRADYSVVLAEDDAKLDMTGWVTIENNSGAEYKDATIKLVAGDVSRVREQRVMNDRAARRGVEMMEAKAPGFAEKAFMEYHMYTLGRKSTINNNQVKQIEFIEPAENVPAEKKFIYEWQKKSDKVQVKIEFENLEENNLGIALPKGKVRVFKRDQADGMLEFVGEDRIDHTAKKEKLSIYIGDAFDIVPEHKVIDSRHSRRKRTETHQIELRNRKESEDITVYVDHVLPAYADWTVDDSSHSYEKSEANKIRFEVPVKADSQVTLEFTVTQRWQM